MPELLLTEIVRLADGELRGSGETRIRGVAPLEGAGPGELSFIANARYLPYLHATHAAAVLVARELSAEVPASIPQVLVGDPHAALARILPALYPAAPREVGVHPTAVVDESADVGEAAYVGPYAVIEAGVRLGARCSIGAHAVVGRGCRLGDDCVVHAHATLYPGVRLGARCVIHSGARLGKEGFGFVWEGGAHRRVQQVGGCVLEDDVEVGCNTTIDRGSIGDTVVGAGTKIDNLVQLGHNVRIGRHAILVSQVGVAGSTAVGDGAVLGGQVGVGGHLKIGAGARIGAQGGVIGDVPAGETYSGYPARPHREALRAQGALFKLPELIRRVRALEKAVLGGGRERE
ncbi:MAG TPA: UDP-3-O-(3-hydroxymyristoyl)glucosamine N-acyltransferase [Longimicrobiaceae bacterium]|nr:UDP-3-O-(3-hydroxymyristoyl)glucosamine N-acyltransferase [Longimicrobiaceae bacterium]